MAGETNRHDPLWNKYRERLNYWDQTVEEAGEDRLPEVSESARSELDPLWNKIGRWEKPFFIKGKGRQTKVIKEDEIGKVGEENIIQRLERNREVIVQRFVAVCGLPGISEGFHVKQLAKDAHPSLAYQFRVLGNVRNIGNSDYGMQFYSRVHIRLGTLSLLPIHPQQQERLRELFNLFAPDAQKN